MPNKYTSEPQWHLAEDDFFENLPSTAKADFMARAARREITKKQFLFFEDDPGDTCYYIEFGAIRIFRFSSMGKEAIMFIRKQGEIFGLAEVIDCQKRKCNAQAVTQSVIHIISKQDFEHLLNEYPPLSRKVIAIMGRRIRYLGEQVENLMVGTVRTRLMKVLTYLSFETIRKTPETDGPISVPVMLSQSEFAAMTGSCQQTISITLNQLQDEGLIDIKDRGIILLKPLKIIEILYGE